MAPYLRPNPRHIKRLVNVYALVRSLMIQKREQGSIAQPETVIRWLVMCGQWPYTSYKLVELFDEIDEAVRNGKETAATTDLVRANPLPELLSRVRPMIDSAMVRRLDHDPEILDQLLSRTEGRVDWEELRVLRQYTVNFNPAVECHSQADAPAPAK